MQSPVHAVKYSVHAVKYSVHSVNYSVHAVNWTFPFTLSAFPVRFPELSASLFRTFPSGRRSTALQWLEKDAGHLVQKT